MHKRWNPPAGPPRRARRRRRLRIMAPMETAERIELMDTAPAPFAAVADPDAAPQLCLGDIAAYIRAALPSA